MKANVKTKTRSTKVARGCCGLAMLLMMAVFVTVAAEQETPAAKEWPKSVPGAVGLEIQSPCSATHCLIF